MKQSKLCLVKDIIKGKEDCMYIIATTLVNNKDTTEVFIKCHSTLIYNYYKSVLDINKRLYFHIYNNKTTGRFQVEEEAVTTRVVRPIEMLTQERFFMEMV